jgi:hypothetical protein
MYGRCGKLHPSFGKKRSLENRKRISESKKGILVGPKNGFYGKHHTEEVKNQISTIHTGKKLTSAHKLALSEAASKNKFKNYESRYGVEKSEEIKKKLSIANKGKRLTKETIQKIKLSSGKHNKEILTFSKQLEKQGYRVVPLTSTLPDIIAVKDNKIYAVEVDNGSLRTYKYDTNNFSKYFDDVLWYFLKDNTFIKTKEGVEEIEI